MLIEALGGVQDLPRLNRIAGVLVRHGLGEMVRRIGLADLLARAGQVLHREHAAELARLPPPVQLRLALEELGPTFVKLGQVLAGRADLLGPEWTNELSRLHSRVPGVALVVSQLIIGSSIVMTVGGGPLLFGLPAFGLVGWAAAVAGGLWLLVSIRRDHRRRDDDPWG